MKLDNIKVGAKMLRIPISVTGAIYALMWLSMIVHLFKNLDHPEGLSTSISSILILPLLAFIHFKAFQAVKSIDKIQLRSSEWNSVPNLILSTFLVLFLVVLFFVLANALALVIFVAGLIAYVFLIFITWGSVLSKHWFTFKYFTHYVLDFWRWEHKGLAHVFPHEHDQTKAVVLLVTLVLFVVPTLISIFVLVFKHLLLDKKASQASLQVEN